MNLYKIRMPAIQQLGLYLVKYNMGKKRWLPMPAGSLIKLSAIIAWLTKNKAPLRLAWFSVPRRGTAGRRISIGLVASVAINAARIRATRFHRSDHRNRSGTDFFVPRRGIVCLWKDISYIWHPDATLIKQNVRCTAGDNRVNCNRIPRVEVCDIPPAPPGDSAGQKIALIATGLY